MKKDNSGIFFELCSSSLQTINGFHFTHREIDILAFLVSGRSGKSIASYLSISPKTVENHTRNIMAKIECNAKESIIDFCEKSGVDNLLRNHYANLLDEVTFKKSLKQIEKLYRDINIVSVITCFQKQQLQEFLISKLDCHLKLVGISTVLKVQENSLPSIMKEAHQDEFVLYVIPKGLFSLPHDFSPQANSKVLFLLSESEDLARINKNFPYLTYYNLKGQKEYYELFFKIVGKILPSDDWKRFIPQFKEKNETGQRHFTPFSLPTNLENKKPAVKEKNESKKLSILKNRLLIFCFFIATFFICGSVFLYHFIASEDRMSLVRADLNIPAESVLIDRSKLIAQIDQTLSNNAGAIKVAAIVGIGGAGKTTLAHQYARKKDAQVIWEINAQTKESLKVSFEKLAQHLAYTEEDKKILREAQNIRQPIEKEEKILFFVQDRLRLYPNWLLVYDNVEQFADIQKYFPQDVTLWGEGKIILTTKNSNIQNNSLVTNVIYIGELSPEQKLDLFAKIMNHGCPHPFISTSSAEVLDFLKNIPPFPLDISVAAYYLKSTKISYKKYLENLENDDKEFANVQENLLKEVGAYLKTRYGIITFSLEHLLQSHKDFAELLLFISLLDSQHIPLDLLKRYKNSSIVDNFIYSLKKYSLIKNDVFNSNQVFSLHRSTQAISLAYLIKKLNLKQGDERVKQLSNTLINYSISAIEADDFPVIKNLIIQYQTFLSHKNLLNTDIAAAIKSMLGSIYSCFYDIIKAKNLIEINFPILNKNYKVMAQALTCLGITEKELGNHQKAKNLLEQSVAIYKDHLSEDDVSFARTIIDLGEVYRLLEDMGKAKAFLEKGINLYSSLSANEVGLARALKYLGLLHRTSGDYEKSKALFEQSLQMYRKKFSNHHVGVAQILVHLGNVYKKLGDDRKAQDLIEESLSIFKDLFATNHAKVAWASLHLGDTYWRLGKYEKAKNIFEESFAIYRKLYPEGNDWIAKVSLKLGEVEKKLGNKEKARTLFETGLKIHQQNSSKINLTNVHYLHQLGDFYNNLENYRQAKLTYIQCLKLYDKKFIRHDLRASSKILLKLGEVYKNLGDYVHAEDIFNNILTIYKKYYGEHHLRTGRVLADLGNLYLLKKDFNSAESYLIKASEIFEKQNPSDLSIVLEDLSNVHQKKQEQNHKPGVFN